MLLGVVLGLAGLAVVAIAFVNRNELSDHSGRRLYAPYLLGAIVAVRLSVGLILMTAQGTYICGPPGDGSRCS
jgi:hypothetical protein